MSEQNYIVICADKSDYSGAEEKRENKEPLFKKFLVGQNEMDMPEYLLTAFGIPFLPKGDIHAVKAKPKSGKTLFMTVLAASVLGAQQFGLSTKSTKSPVLYADTEQNKHNTSMFIQRVDDILSYNSPYLYALSLREVSSPESKLDIIISAIASLKPALTVIDGIADITSDFNDIEKSSEIIAKLSKIAQQYNTAIVNVLHTNKAQGDSNMKGHLGSLLLQKASDVFEVKRTGDNIFTVTQTDTRNAPISPIRFYVEEETEDGTNDQNHYNSNNNHRLLIKPYKKGNIGDADGDSPKIEYEKSIMMIMRDFPNGVNYSQLARNIADIIHKSERTAKNIIKAATENGLLVKNNENGLLLLNQPHPQKDDNSDSENNKNT